MGDTVNQYTKVIYSNAAGSIVFDAAGDFWIEGVSGLQTEVEIQTTQSVGQLGATVDGQAVKPKEPTIDGAIVRCVEERRAQLLAVLLPMVPSRLTFVLGSGEGWYLDGWLKQAPILSDGQKPQHFQFRFFAPYPYFRSTECKRYQLSGLTALWRTPFHMSGTKKISTYTEDAFKRIENSGSMPQSIKLELTADGEVTNPEIWNVDQGKRIAIIKVMKPGERFLISTHDADKDAGTAVQYITADGQIQNGFRLLTPDSDLALQVAAGGNIFMARAEANKKNLCCILVTSGGERHGI